MLQKSRSVQIPKRQGQKTIELLCKLGLLDKNLQIKKDHDSIYAPITRQISKQELSILKDAKIEFAEEEGRFEQKAQQKKSLADELSKELSPHLLATLPHSLDLIGDIAIIEIPPELEAQREAIGKAILRLHRNVHTVLGKAGAVSGKFRTRQFDFLAGEPRTETTHKEHGCLYRVDVAKTYFSPRLSQEHKRVSSLVQEGETITDLFSGVGPFAVLIAKEHENVQAYAIDANPDAVKYLKTNIRLNGVIGKVHPLLGDAKEVVDKKIHGAADRVIMNLPETAIEYVDVACQALKPEGGIVHFYSFTDTENTLQDVMRRFVASVESSRRKIKKILGQRVVRETAPHEAQIVVDARVA